MIKGLKKIFKTKSQKDVTKLYPVVGQISDAFDKLNEISNDALRQKVTALKKDIQDELSEYNDKIETLRSKVQDEEIDIDKKSSMYEEIERLEAERDEKLENVLSVMLPEVFAIVKQTAKRFYENDFLEVKANAFDKELSTNKDYVKIEGEKAVYACSWNVGGHKKKWDMVHYDVQLIGGVVLHQGKIAEMATGEGKTLVSTLPTFLNALSGFGVHMVTVNDYLAKRDAEWMAPIYEFHGMSVDCIDLHKPHSEERKSAYRADVVYGTNNEFGFDYLRDNMSRTFDELVQRKLHFSIVDEVDSVLIDDARTPLIISGPVSKSDHEVYMKLKPDIERLFQTQKNLINTVLNEAKKKIDSGDDGHDSGGMALLRAFRGLPKNKALIKYLSDPEKKKILTKTENFYMQERNKHMPKVDAELYFVIDEKNRQVDLTDKGLDLINSWMKDSNFFILPDLSIELDRIEKEVEDPSEQLKLKDEVNKEFVLKSERIHSVQQLLKAYALFEKDVDYVLEDNKVKIVDEQTGRIMEGRRYSDGLHQALEAKENVKVEDATQTFATITLQNYFRMYHKLAGMTGTASTEANEFWQIYKLDVVEIPTNLDVVRKDAEDLVYRTVREKYNAIVQEITTLVKAGRPVLVGTTSVENSEIISRMLNMRNIKHQVLNAKLHHREADIVAQAGNPGTVTIATNMAGRGTDIKLGKGVKEAGGLAIVGTEKHESRRVDRQLRGRAGRQGDPGSSQFFVSLEDPLMRLFGSGRISNIMQKMGYKEGEVIQHSMITRSIERAQKRVEENNFGIRKRLLEYDDVMNSQRSAIYEKRRNSMYSDKLKIDLNNMFYEGIEVLVDEAYQSGDYPYLKDVLAIDFNYNLHHTEEVFKTTSKEALTEELSNNILNQYNEKNKLIVEKISQYLTLNLSGQNYTYERLIIPFTDGLKILNISSSIKKLIESKGKEVINSFEKHVTLSIIDESWKEHLRKMDDLRQMVQNTVYEQKDPLLIYKFEAYELFKTFLAKMNKDVISFLVKGYIPVIESNTTLQKADVQRTDFSNTMNVKQDYQRNTSRDNVNPYNQSNQPAAPVETMVRTVPKVGRNELCKCGSGKKYKNCHGKNQRVSL